MIPLAGVNEVNAFLLSVTWSDNMYGWPFLDGSEDATSTWPDPISLDFRIPDGEAEHSIYWYAECGWNRAEDDSESFFIQGMIRFGEFEVRRADDAIVPLDDFIADGRRPWDLMRTEDERISGQAQRIAHTGVPRWRYWQASD